MKISSTRTILMLFLFIPFLGYSQYNADVSAEILVTENTEFTELRAKASNATEVNQDLRFVFSIFRKENEAAEQTTTKKEGNFSLDSFKSEILSEVTINKIDTAQVIVLFLVYNSEEKLLGKARWSQNEAEKQEPIVVEKEVFKEVTYDAAILRGIVTEDTRTKPGRDFYRYFYNDYDDSQINAEETVSVKEFLALGRNTRIEVRIGSTLVSQFYLRPKDDYLRNMSKVTLSNIARYIQNQKNMSQQIERY
ncbi:Curli assembly protein CsgE [Ulvibacter litoralis]|uniref:Curli production assembly/transport component CsgE n=2 Tax=Ulvibacter litoralis TaxID=227084 RepID=A0A1G7GP22_9FLAO|nr:Curli assembly protein CsgE [Ulvibacter litoralis]